MGMEGRKPVMYCPIAKDHCKSSCVFYDRKEREVEFEVATVEWDPASCKLAAALTKLKG
ncbi:MAG: hypothetical protein L6427_01575 [Actinomycetia bacterium]|nr:hypothetical protein [Actinomycetota bacterium]MCG2794558.1 hypothetical protein [Actinomycetes bacterium]